MFNSSWKKKGGSAIKALWPGKKKFVYIAGALAVIAVVAFGVYLVNKKADLKVIQQKQKVEEDRAQRMSNATWSRVSFFEGLPINVTLAVPSYLEGNYRMIKSPNSVAFLYIKNPEIPTSMLDIKVFKQEEFKLGEGDKELKSDCPGYSFSYRLYPSDSYSGDDKDGFAQAIFDFNFFLSGDGYFKCFPRQ